MATVYYPETSLISSRQVVDQSGLTLIETVIDSPPGAVIIFSSGSTGTASFVSASFAVTASYALNGGGTGITPGGSYNISASWVSQSLSSSYSFTSSYALNGGGAGVTSGGSYNISASYASKSLSASWAPGGTPTFTGTFDNNVPVWINDQLSTTSSLFVNSNQVYINGQGSTSPEVLYVRGTSSVSPNFIAEFTHDTNTYAQIKVENSNTGSSGSADIIVETDKANENIGYSDFGINSSNYYDSNFGLTGPLDSYLYAVGSGSIGGNLVIGTFPVSQSNITNSGSIIFHTSGSRISDERMRIDYSGSIGINVKKPAAKFHVSGSDGSFPLFQISTPKIPNLFTISASTHVITISGSTIRFDAGSTNYSAIKSTSPYFGFFTDSNTALPIKARSLVLSTAYTNTAPTNGIFCLGNYTGSTITASVGISSSLGQFSTLTASAIQVDGRRVGETCDVQRWSTAGTYTWLKPTGSVVVNIIMWGGGGGGGGGTVWEASGYGATGGAGGAALNIMWPADLLNSTETVIVGAGGNAGAATGSSATKIPKGNNGASGGTSRFSNFTCYGGSGGLGGSGSSVAADGSGGQLMTFGGRFGCNNIAPSITTTPSNPTFQTHAGGGGGAGGSISAAGVALNGGAGSVSYGLTGTTSGPGGAAGGNNGSSGSAPQLGFVGGGGGGGGGSINSNGGNGGSGSMGSGGGGGGTCKTGSWVSGAGGPGGSGSVIIITYF